MYLDMKRKGVGGFGRIVAFWLGNPATWFTFLFVPEGRQPRFQPPRDDEEALLSEIRRDRKQRGLTEPTTHRDEATGEGTPGG